jgi:hypothetical protein
VAPLLVVAIAVVPMARLVAPLVFRILPMFGKSLLDVRDRLLLRTRQRLLLDGQRLRAIITITALMLLLCRGLAEHGPVLAQVLMAQVLLQGPALGIR